MVALAHSLFQGVTPARRGLMARLRLDESGNTKLRVEHQSTASGQGAAGAPGPLGSCYNATRSLSAIKRKPALRLKEQL